MNDYVFCFYSCYIVLSSNQKANWFDNLMKLQCCIIQSTISLLLVEIPIQLLIILMFCALNHLHFEGRSFRYQIVRYWYFWYRQLYGKGNISYEITNNDGVRRVYMLFTSFIKWMFLGWPVFGYSLSMQTNNKSK